MTEPQCPECKAPWNEGRTCRDHFDQMLAWDFEDPGGAGAVHHLTVLCYHLQHPSRYSQEGLRYGKGLLVEFLNGAAPARVRKANRKRLDSGNREWSVGGNSGVPGFYEHPVEWSMTAADVTAGGITEYCTRVRAWARSVYEALKSSGNLSAM